MHSWRLRALLLALPLSSAAFAATAADDAARSAEDYGPPALPNPSPITDHFALTAGFYWGQVDTFGQFNSGKGVPGTVLTAENDLGLTNKAYQPRFEILFRLKERGRLRVNFFDLRRNGEVQLENTILFGDQTFRAAQPLQTTISWRQMDLTYTYSFLKGERYELGAGLGVHLLEAEAMAQVPSTPQRVDYSQAGPFATLAIDGTYLIARRWSLNARAQYLRLTINSFTGEIEDIHGDVQYRWRRNFAVGISYDHAVDEVNIRNHDPSGEIRLQLTGPQLFVRVSY